MALPISLGVFAAPYLIDKAKKVVTGQAHTGSAGTPDVGITEDAARVLNKVGIKSSNTSDNGSNIFKSENTTGKVVQPVTNAVNAVKNTASNAVNAVKNAVNRDSGGNQTQNEQKPAQNQPDTQSTGKQNMDEKVTINGVTKTRQSAKDEGLADENGNLYTSDYLARREAEQNARRQQLEEETRNNINSGFDEIESGLGKMAEDWRTREEEARRGVDTMATNVRSGIETAKNTALEGLANSRNQVGERVKRATQSVADNMNQMRIATAMQLGSIGAGDSSATEKMAPFAYQKLAGRNQTDIQNQANDQYADIDQYEVEIKKTYDEMFLNLESEIQASLEDIRRTYGSQIASVEQALANAKGQRAQALAALSDNLRVEAATQLQSLEQYKLNKASEIETWARDRMAQLNNYKIEAATKGKSLQYNPQDIVTAELSAPNIGLPQSVDTFYNPQMIAQRRKALGYDS